jgi:hypothetical protein
LTSRKSVLVSAFRESSRSLSHQPDSSENARQADINDIDVSGATSVLLGQTASTAPFSQKSSLHSSNFLQQYANHLQHQDYSHHQLSIASSSLRLSPVRRLLGRCLWTGGSSVYPLLDDTSRSGMCHHSVWIACVDAMWGDLQFSCLEVRISIRDDKHGIDQAADTSALAIQIRRD